MTFPPLPPTPQLSPEMQHVNRMRAEAERRRSMLLNVRASEAAQGITPEEPVEIDPVSLEPQVDFQPPEEELDRHSFFGRLQSFQDLIGTTVLTALPFPMRNNPEYHQKRAVIEKDYLESMGKPTNPWQHIRRQVMIDTEAYRQTDMPTVAIDIVPGSGINHPLGKLNEVNLGVKGAVETIADPLNYIPVVGPVKIATKVGLTGLRKAGLHSVANVAETSIRAGRDALESGKQLMPKRLRKNIEADYIHDADGAHIPPTEAWKAERLAGFRGIGRETIEDVQKAVDDATERPYRFFRGEPSRTKDTTDAFTPMGQPDNQGLGDGIYITTDQNFAAKWKAGEVEGEVGKPLIGEVDEYRLMDLTLNDNKVYEDVLQLGDDLSTLQQLKPLQYAKLKAVTERLVRDKGVFINSPPTDPYRFGTFEELLEMGALKSMRELPGDASMTAPIEKLRRQYLDETAPSLVGDWYAWIRGQLQGDYAGGTSKVINKELAGSEGMVGEVAIKVIDGRAPIRWDGDVIPFPHVEEAELLVLPGHENILRRLRSAPGIRGETGSWIEPNSMAVEAAQINKDINKLPGWLKTVNAWFEGQKINGRTTFSGKMLGPLGWALGKVNPTARMTVFQAGDAVGKKIKTALYAHQRMTAAAASMVEYTQITLSSFKSPVPLIKAGAKSTSPELDNAMFVNSETFDELVAGISESSKPLFTIRGRGPKNLLSAETTGVFDLDDAGLLTNVLLPDGTILQTTGKFKDEVRSPYAFFSSAFEPELEMGGELRKAGFRFSDTYDKVPASMRKENPELAKRVESLGQVVRHGPNTRHPSFVRAATEPHQLLELPAESIEWMIKKGEIDEGFVEQAFAIKHVQEWYSAARRMFDSHGVDVKDVYKDQGDYLKYIHRVAIGKDGQPLPDRLITPGSVQPIDKARSNIEDLFLEASQDGVDYETNFLLAARDFADSAYQKIRDQGLKNELDKYSYKVRQEYLPLYQEALGIAKDDLTKVQVAKSWIKELKSKANLPGGRDKALRALGERLGFAYNGDYVSAKEITERRIKAIKNLQNESVRLEKEAESVSRMIGKLLERGKRGEPTSLREMMHKLIPHGIITDADRAAFRTDFVTAPDALNFKISEYFRTNFPEFSEELNKIRGLEITAEKYKGKKVERLAPVPVVTKTPAAAKGLTIYKSAKEITGVVRRSLRQTAKEWTNPDSKTVKKIWLENTDTGEPMIFYLTKANADELATGNLSQGVGKKWHIFRHIPATDKRVTPSGGIEYSDTSAIAGQFSKNPLNNGEAVSSLAKAKKIVEAEVKELRKDMPKTVERAGEAFGINRRRVVRYPGRDEKVSAAAQKAANTLRNKLRADVKKHKERTNTLRKRLKEINGRKPSGATANFLKAHFPYIRKQLVAALDIDSAPVRKQRLDELNAALDRQIEMRKQLVKHHDRINRRQRAKYAGRLHIKAGALDPVSGKHDLEVLTGKDLKEYEGKTLIVKEPSQRNLPFLKGMFFEEPDIKAIENALTIPETQTNIGMFKGVFLRVVPAIGDVTRVLKAGFDFGAPFLQGIPVLARRPDVWLKATARHYAVFARGGQVHTRYLQQNMEALREMVELGIPFSGAASDYYLAVQRNAVLPKLGQGIEATLLKGSDKAPARMLRKGGRTFADVGARFENAFEAFGDYSRIELFKSLRNTAVKSGPDGLNDLAAFIRNATGALNTGTLGASPSQQAFERGWLFFSPRYTRASLALVADAFQGGLRGQQARQTFGQMLTGGAVLYMGVCKALGQPVKLDPRPKDEGGNGAEFMTVNIAGQNVGIGSFWTSFIRLVASMGTTAADDPALFASPSTRDNPIMKWMRSRSAPMTGFTSDFINGANFLGEPLEDPIDWTKHIGRQTLPFAVENAIFEEGAIFGRLGVGVPVEMSGGRTFPVDRYSQRDSEREVAAMERFGKEWDSLNALQKKALENDPNRPLGHLSREIREEAEKMRFADPRTSEGMIDNWFRSKEEIELQWRSVVKNGVRLFNDGTIDTVVFKERHLEPANGDRRRRVGDLNDDEAYTELQKYFADLADKNGPIPVEDILFVNYIETIVTNPEYEDPVIGFDFRAKEADEKLWADEYGHEMLAYTKARFKAAREAYDFAFPALIDELYYGRERFSWYWDQVEREVLALQKNPDRVLEVYESWLKQTPTDKEAIKKENRELREFLSTMSKTRQVLREQNADLDIFMYRWGFTSTLRHKDNQWTDGSGGALSFYRTHLPTAFPYAVQK